jgi:prepilin-type N-terminal cleavage/methylation domain-containing protein
MKKILSNRNGFTLIEAVISLAVLSIGILAMFAMQTLGIRGNANASRISTQATWSQNEAEQIIGETYGDKVPRVESDIDHPSKLLLKTTSDGYNIQRTIVAEPILNMKTVTITLTNVSDGKQVLLRRLKRNENAY